MKNLNLSILFLLGIARAAIGTVFFRSVKCFSKIFK